MEKSSLIATVTAIIIVSIAVIFAARLSWILLVWSTGSLVPLFISLACAFLFPKSTCQTTLAVGSILYTVWMVLVVVYGFLIYPGPLSPLVLFVGPIYSLPIMLIIWIVAAIQNASVQKNVVPKTQDN